jgi:hypothetical protein
VPSQVPWYIVKFLIMTQSKLTKLANKLPIGRKTIMCHIIWRILAMLTVAILMLILSISNPFIFVFCLTNFITVLSSVSYKLYVLYSLALNRTVLFRRKQKCLFFLSHLVFSAGFVIMFYLPNNDSGLSICKTIILIAYLAYEYLLLVNVCIIDLQILVLLAGMIIEGFLRIVACKLSHPCTNFSEFLMFVKLKEKERKFNNNSSIEFSKENKHISACSICLDDFYDGENVFQLTCNKIHVFHKNCIISWYRGHETCPICRTKAQIK